MTVSNHLRRSSLIGAGVAAIALSVACVLVWNTQNHEARIGLGWAVPALLAAAATGRDLKSQQPPTTRVSFAVTAAWFYFLALLTLLVLLFGWVLSVLGIIFGIPATALAWLARSRARQGRTDGALLCAAMLIATGAFALTRPWTPSSQEWLWGAGVAFAAAVVAVGDVVVHRFARHTAEVTVS